jgi:hypothetical protein
VLTLALSATRFCLCCSCFCSWYFKLLLFLAYILWGNVRMRLTTCPSSWECKAMFGGWAQLFALGLPGMVSGRERERRE